MVRCDCEHCAGATSLSKAEDNDEEDFIFSSPEIIKGWFSTSSSLADLQSYLEAIKKENDEIIKTSICNLPLVIQLSDPPSSVARQHTSKPPSRISQCSADLDLSTKDRLISGNSVSASDVESPRIPPSFARVGSRAALGFICSFLRRAWRSGIDSEICTEFLTDLLDALRELPDASLYNTPISDVWTDLIERSWQFFITVATGETVNNLPMGDRRLAICILLELAIQHGTLSKLLQILTLMLELYNKDNGQLFAAPVIPSMERFRDRAELQAGSVLSANSNPNLFLLNGLRFPDNPDTNIDLKRAVIVIMANCDKLALSYLQSDKKSLDHEANASTEKQAEVHIKDSGMIRVTLLDSLRKAVFTKNFLVALDSDDLSERVVAVCASGREFSVVDEVRVANGHKVIQIASTQHHNTVILITDHSQLFQWEIGASTFKAASTLKTPLEFDLIAKETLVKVVCTKSSYAVLTCRGRVATWGRSDSHCLGHRASFGHISISTPSPVATLRGIHIIDISAASTHILACSDKGDVFWWGRRMIQGDSSDDDQAKTTNLPQKMDDGSFDTVHVKSVFATDQENFFLSIEDDLLLVMDRTQYQTIHHPCDRRTRSKIFTFPNFYYDTNDKNSARGLLYTDDDGYSCTSFVPRLKNVGHIAANDYMVIKWPPEARLNPPDDSSIPPLFVLDPTAPCVTQLVSLIDDLYGCIIARPLPAAMDMECLMVSAVDLLRVQLVACLKRSSEFDVIGGAALETLKQQVVKMACVAETGLTSCIANSAQQLLSDCWSVLLPTTEERISALLKFLQGEDTSLGYRFVVRLLVDSLLKEGELGCEVDKCVERPSENSLLLDLVKFLLRELRLSSLKPTHCERLQNNAAHDLLANFQSLLMRRVTDEATDYDEGIFALSWQIADAYSRMLVDEVSELLRSFAQGPFPLQSCHLGEIAVKFVVHLSNIGVVSYPETLLRTFVTLQELMPLLDKANRMTPKWETDEMEALSWPGIHTTVTHQNSNQFCVIRPERFANEIHSGKKWVVVDEQWVLDVANLNIATCAVEENRISSDSEAGRKLIEILSSRNPDDIVVGRYIPPDKEQRWYEKNDRPFVELERCLAFVMGTYCNMLFGLAVDRPADADEACLFARGLAHVNDDQQHEKVKSESFCNDLARGKSAETENVINFMRIVEKMFTPQHHQVTFPADVSNAYWTFLAVLIRHHGAEENCNAIGQFSTMDSDANLPDNLRGMCKLANQFKWKLVKLKQETGEDYSQLLPGISSRLHFLLSEICHDARSHPNPGQPTRWQAAFDKVKKGRPGDTSGWNVIVERLKAGQLKEDVLGRFVSPQYSKALVRFALDDSKSLKRVESWLLELQTQARFRVRALKLFTDTVDLDLIPTARLVALVGWTGIGSKERLLPVCAWDNISWKLKQELGRTVSTLVQWSVGQLRGLVVLLTNYNTSIDRLVNTNKCCSDISCHPYCHLLLMLVQLVVSHSGAFEVSISVDSGLIALLVSALKLLDRPPRGQSVNDSQVAFEASDRSKRRLQASKLNGPETAAALRIGCKVVRGADWKWEDQDGPFPSIGRIVGDVGNDGWVRVQWEHGPTNSYRMGKEGKYDLQLAQSDCVREEPPEKSTTIAEHEDPLLKPLHWSLTNCFRFVLGSIASCGDSSLFRPAARRIGSLLCTILRSRSLETNDLKVLFGWLETPFLESLIRPAMFPFITSELWFDTVILLVKDCDRFVEKVSLIRLLGRCLGAWEVTDQPRMVKILSANFDLMANIGFDCVHDQSIIEAKGRPLRTAAYSSSLLEELVGILRQLQGTKPWNTVLSKFITDRMSRDVAPANQEPVFDQLIGAAVFIGGIDDRLRWGAKCSVDGRVGTIMSVSKDGRLSVMIDGEEEGPSGCFANEVDSFWSQKCSTEKLIIDDRYLKLWDIYFTQELPDTSTDSNDFTTKSHLLFLSVIRALRRLSENSDILRKMLSWLLVPTNTSELADGDKSEDCTGHDLDGGNVDRATILQRLLVVASQPSPVKPIFDEASQKECVLAVCQHLLSGIRTESSFDNFACEPTDLPVEAFVKRKSLTGPLPVPPKMLSAKAKKPGKALEEVVIQAVDMGFPRKQAEQGYTALNSIQGKPPRIEVLVNWLCENHSSDTDDDTDGDSSLYSSDDDDDDDEDASSDDILPSWRTRGPVPKVLFSDLVYFNELQS